MRYWVRYLSVTLLMIFLLVLMTGCVNATNKTVDNTSWNLLWQGYAKKFIDPQGRVIDFDQGDITTSEGQSYALFFSLVDNDPVLFRKILDWTQNNLAQGSLSEHLPAWKWGKRPDGSWGVLSPHSAADADLWIAYTLTEAGRLWKKPAYSALGALLAKRIAQEEVANIPGIGPMLLPGNIGFHNHPDTYVLNPSYLPLPVISGLGNTLPQGPWVEMAKALPSFIKDTTPTGFAPSWVTYTVGKGFGPAPESKDGTFNSIRVYLWAGICNPATPGAQAITAALHAMPSYLESHILPPLTVNWLTGKAAGEGPVGFSAAVMPLLKRLHRTESFDNQQLRLTADFDPKTGLYGKHPRYYDENLTLFAMGFLNGVYAFSKNGALEPAWFHGG
ncbi:cellulose synthase complex periplasmic endoglucanase BcsZ [Candidatus Igneacidithiobacillus taiwanensis]|uniref:cellulose synthase complex periplasmic endoglucanase BcsZ n=1 Tax=Candidatus Igneacidithiobacillus taiwanensis TaxID=1945924 RepID=UPI00289DDC5E|nr:cellulose synthase complex periplasmic endoglucanase BcsZ [Candidatus Igneacidithiobacillus taiwanensis]